MALADYRLCDVCNGKCFYDANMDYDFDVPSGALSYKLGYMGDWAVICDKCSKEWKCVVIKREETAV